MKILLSILLLSLLSCYQQTIEPNHVINGMNMIKYEYEGHDYLIFRGLDYFSAVVHSASCNYCDSLKHIK